MLDRPNQTTTYVSERRTKKQRRKEDAKQVKQKKAVHLSFLLVRFSQNEFE